MNGNFLSVNLGGFNLKIIENWVNCWNPVIESFFMSENYLVYQQYIQYLRKKQGTYLKGTKLEKHRVVPKHAGGTYTPENILHMTFREHTLAHYYRFLEKKEKGDYIAFLFMSNQTEDGRRALASFAGKIGGTENSRRNKVLQKLFFDQEWQKQFGDRKAGKRNVETGFLRKLHEKLTQENPQQRSHAGKLGGKARIAKQKREQTALFNPSKINQKKGNLIRWGIKIDGVRIPYENLSSDFVLYHLHFGTKKEYFNPKS